MAREETKVFLNNPAQRMVGSCGVVVVGPGTGDQVSRRVIIGLARFHGHVVQSIATYTFLLMVSDSACQSPNLLKLVVLPLIRGEHVLKFLLQKLMKSGLGKQEQVINMCTGVLPPRRLWPPEFGTSKHSLKEATLAWIA